MILETMKVGLGAELIWRQNAPIWVQIEFESGQINFPRVSPASSRKPAPSLAAPRQSVPKRQLVSMQ